MFVLHCIDRQDAAALRESQRQAHADYMRRHADFIVLGGPLLAPDGESRIGITVVLDMANATEAQAFVDAEPYHRAGLFASVSLIPFQVVMQRPFH